MLIKLSDYDLSSVLSAATSGDRFAGMIGQHKKILTIVGAIFAALLVIGCVVGYRRYKATNAMQQPLKDLELKDVLSKPAEQQKPPLQNVQDLPPQIKIEQSTLQGNSDPQQASQQPSPILPLADNAVLVPQAEQEEDKETDSSDAQELGDPVPEVQQENSPSVEPNIDPVKQQLIDRFTPQMVEALGGIETVLSDIPDVGELPKEFGPGDLLSPEGQKKYPYAVMRATQCGHPCLLFNLEIEAKEDETARAHHAFATMTKPEILYLWSDKGWRGFCGNGPNDKPQLNLGMSSSSSINPESLTGHHMFDRIRRLIQDGKIGPLKLYPHLNHKRAEDIANPPQDAFLKGDALLEYMKEESIAYYEKQCDEGHAVYLVAYEE